MKEQKQSGEVLRSFDSYRQSIDQAILELMQLGEGELFEMMSYHLGYDGSASSGEYRGKQIRPSLCMFTTEVLGGEASEALPAAVSLELIHNFSLVHDDIQDDDDLRRGRESVQAKWGPEQAINAGDGLKDLSSLALTRLGEGTQPRKTLAALDALNSYSLRMIKGQVQDLEYATRDNLSVEEYLDLISKKTCSLLEAAFHLGGLYAGTPEIIPDLKTFGRHLGYVYQIRDDWLGIWGEPSKSGKSASTDLYEKKKSYPVVYTLREASPDRKELLQEIYRLPAPLGPEEVEKVRSVLSAEGAREGTQKAAERHWDIAQDKLSTLPFSAEGKETMNRFGSFLLNREK